MNNLSALKAEEQLNNNNQSPNKGADVKQKRHEIFSRRNDCHFEIGEINGDG